MAVLTTKQKVDLVNNFITAVESNNNSYYCFVGKAEPWRDASGNIDETKIQDSVDSVMATEQNIYSNMVYGKKLLAEDIIHMTKRYNWNYGEIYTRYNNEDKDIYDKNFYVINHVNEVYKCIHNGYSPSLPDGRPSTVEPSIPQTSGNFETRDGYIWKYMFTCNPTDYDSFQTSNYIPVTPNNDVIANSIPGTIDFITLDNPGQGYEVFEEGFLKGIVNNYVVELAPTSSEIDNYYTNCSIYIKAGGGAGQIRRVSGYSGIDKRLSVDPNFNYYEKLDLQNINGEFELGALVFQRLVNTTYLYKSGYFNTGDVLTQVEDGGVAKLRRANTTVMVFDNLSNTHFTSNYPIINTSESPIQKTGLVNITSGNNIIESDYDTAFETDYAVNQYILVGEDSNTNIRRIVSINAIAIEVDSPFLNNLNSANNYLVNNAIFPESVTNHTNEGSIVFVNLNSSQITYGNTIPVGENFVIGEIVDLVDSSNTSQGANGIVSFANTTTLILTDVQNGGGIQSNLYLRGLTSEVRSQIITNDTYPFVTVETIKGGFSTGFEVISNYANGVPSGNAIAVFKETSPNEKSEYIISPQIIVSGDGNGAMAYSTVDLSGQNPSRAITSITMIDHGRNYTRANVSIISPQGSNAIMTAQVSPVHGHGYDAYTELAAKYCGISKKFDTAQNESYYLPLYGSYRTVGIIKNPQFKDVVFEVGNFDRVKLNIANTSGVFEAGEIVVQPYSNSAGIVVYSNSSMIELKNVKGTFAKDSVNLANTSTVIYGWVSDANTHCTNSVPSVFSTSALGFDSIIDSSTGASAKLTEVISETFIRASNAVGSFLDNDYIYESYSNTYANIVGIYTSNGTVDSTTNYGLRFNQTARLTLSSNTRNFDLYEYVTQEVVYATGRVISKIDELDIVYGDNIDWVVGEVLINDTTGSNAIITSVNSVANFMSLGAVNNDSFNEEDNKPFNVGDTIRNNDNTKNTTINTVYNVLVLDDVNSITSTSTTPFIGEFKVSDVVGEYNVVGNTSGSVATLTLPNSVKKPDFVRESGDVIYFENVNKFDKTPESTEQLKLIIKF
jgi:hypothetical protein